MIEPVFTISSAYSGRVFATRVDLDIASKWVADYRGDGIPGRTTGHGRDARPALAILSALAPGCEWRSHDDDARGITVRRVMT